MSSTCSCRWKLGVIMYLERTAIAATLRAVALAAAGSALDVSYLLPAQYYDESGNDYFVEFNAMANALGEPLLSFHDPQQAEELVRSYGLIPAPGADWLQAGSTGPRTAATPLRPWNVERVPVADVV